MTISYDAIGVHWRPRRGRVTRLHRARANQIPGERTLVAAELTASGDPLLPYADRSSQAHMPAMATAFVITSKSRRLP